MNELNIRIKQHPASIEINFEEIEAALKAELNGYGNAVFTAESKDIAKSTLASLRAKKKEFDEARKKVKKEYMEPYDKFEKQCKKLLALFDEPIGLIDKQIKEFDEARKEEKRVKINQAYNELVQEFKDFLPISKIYDPKWENATTSMKSIKDSLSEMVAGVKTSLDSIRAMHSECEGRAIEEYRKNLSLADAMAYITQYEKQKAEILIRERECQLEEAEHAKQEEIQKAVEAERERANQAQTSYPEATEHPEQMSFDDIWAPEDSEFSDELPFIQPGKTVKALYTVIATPDELEQVEMAFNSIGIFFQKEVL